MKKVLLVLVAVTGFIFSANAQDIILKKDGSEIKAKVLEITEQQVKYKDFNFQDGPTRNINISEIFMVTYANGQKEVFNKPAETKENADNKQSKEKTNKVKPPQFQCVNKNAFGLDFGIGGSIGQYYIPTWTEPEPHQRYPTVSLGFRYMHHFNPYFGADFIDLSIMTEFDSFFALQFMTGIRGNTPTFKKCMSGYGAFRLGVFPKDGVNFCLETELGVNLTRTIFAGIAYNYLTYHPCHTFSLRVGFNFGKPTESKTKEPKEHTPNVKTVKEVVVVRDTVTVIKEVIREIPLEIRQTMVELSKTLFAFNEFNLNEKSISELNKVVNWLKQNSGINVEIEGHTDNKGTAEYNQQLSEERAKSVYDYFVKNGISASRLSYKGYGLTRPIADNTTEAGHQQNRRVELKIISKD